MWAFLVLSLVAQPCLTCTQLTDKSTDCKRATHFHFPSPPAMFPVSLSNDPNLPTASFLREMNITVSFQHRTEEPGHMARGKPHRERSHGAEMSKRPPNTEAGPAIPSDAGLAWSSHVLRARPRPSPRRSLSVPSEHTYNFALNSNSCSYILALCPGEP